MAMSTATALRRSMLILALVGFIAGMLWYSNRGAVFSRTVPMRRLAIAKPTARDEEFFVRNINREPCSHVYFLKMHKSASTTIQRIILMYGLRHNLTFVLPLKNSNVFREMPFHPDITKRTATHPFFDIMAVHSRFTSDAVKYMPNDTVFLSIVRDPADQLDSAFHYYYNAECIRHGGIEVHLSNGSFSNTAPTCSPTMRTNCNIQCLRNMQLYDFGVNLTSDDTVEQVQREINQIETRFHLVLIMEMLDEGLILMRDLLNWETEDILNFKMNFRLNPNNISQNTRENAYRYNWADKIMYDFFRAKMVSMIAKKSAYISAQLKEFRTLQAELFNFCIDTVGSQRKGSDAAASFKLTAHGLRNDRCRLMAMEEMPLIAYINKLRPAVQNVSGIHRTVTKE